MKTLRLIMVVGGIALMIRSSAEAVPTLFLSDGQGNEMTLSGESGPISFDGALGDFKLSLATIPISGDDIMPGLTFSSIFFTGSGMGTLTVLFSDDSFSPFAGTIASAINGKTNGDVFYSTFADSSNSLFGMTTLLSEQGPFSNASFSATGYAASSLQYPFSLTEQFVISESSGAVTSFSSTLTDPPDAVPDSGSTGALLGLVLLALTILRRKLTTA
jgi:VPDSG-CTERM motif